MNYPIELCQQTAANAICVGLIGFRNADVKPERRRELGGRAKAIVVTGSREAAVRYKFPFDAYIKARGYSGIRSLVAFSGSLELDDLPESELPERFDGEEYSVLLVAEKYQTGFNQLLLQRMYVVRKLAGVQAVQTLSRLNRTAPGKTRTFVLDLANEEAVRQMFPGGGSRPHCSTGLGACARAIAGRGPRARRSRRVMIGQW